MSLTSSLFAGVSGLNSQGTVLGIIGDNIANISTVGFKSGSAVFESLVTGSVSTEGGSGAIAKNRLEIDQQGLIQNTGVNTDVAISGQGFFVVNNNAIPENGEYSFTRAGSFRQDERGFFVNSAGFVLQAWQLDNDGRRPGEIGNANTEPFELLASLSSVNTRDISGIAFATTGISLGVNLDAGQTPLGGASDSLNPVSIQNTGLSSSALLSPRTGEIETGDILTVSAGGALASSFTYGGFVQGNDIQAANIFGVGLPATKFTDVGIGAGQVADGDTFTVTTIASGTVTYTFENDGTPDTSSGEFNSLDTLAQAINLSTGLIAKVSGEGAGVSRLLLSSTDATEAVTLANGVGNTGNGGAGGAGSLINSLGIQAPVTAAGGRFNTLDGLAALTNADPLLTSSVSSASANAQLTIAAVDPLATIQFGSTTLGTGDLITEFGLVATVIDSTYSAITTGRNMASGAISPAFSRNLRVFDSQGSGHDIRVAFVKRQNNEWLAEVFAANPDEVIDAGATTPGLLASGTIEFNGDGTLRNISPELQAPISAAWANGSEASSITLNLGTAGEPAGTAGATTIGLSDGLSQFNGAYNVQFSEQNGSGSGLLSSLEIDEEGFIIANFSNGQSRQVFKIPLASFPNPNGLAPEAGNIFKESDASGALTLSEAGSSGVGILSVSALEQANTELADELTQLIVAQRAFQANTKIITTADELLEELNRI